ncbi:MAG: Xaa-Pro dipeptidase [Myxococcales bacterium]
MDSSELSRLHREHVALLQRGVGAALEASGYGAVALHSGTPQLRTRFDDRFWPLLPSPCFQHWLPLAEPGCVLVAAAGRQPLLLRPRETSFWEAPPPPALDHFWGPFEVRDIFRAQDAKEHLPGGRTAFIGDDLAAAAALGFAREDVNPAGLLAALDALRVHKTPYEIACLSEANLRAAPGHDMLRAMFAQLDHAELELHLAYLAATAQDDAETPYKNIVALGPHAATLHHVSYGKKPSAAQSLLLDAGASFAGYCSDITRTWVKGTGAAASAFAQLVAAVEALQQRLCASVRTGVPYEELHDQAHRFVADALREVGISRLPADELVSSGVTRAFFPHGLGHSLGLVCHDVGCGLTPPRADNPWLRNTSVIAPRQVFTIEPGIYFIPALLDPVRAGPQAGQIDWALVDALAQLGGVRIEDDLVVEAGGVRNLTRERLPTGGGTVIRRKAPR